MIDTELAICAIAARTEAEPRKDVLVAISGIDGSGKTTIARRLSDDLGGRGVRAALIHLDPWHASVETRFSQARPAEHFYERAFRFEELFSTLILPLKARRSIAA